MRLSFLLLIKLSFLFAVTSIKNETVTAGKTVVPCIDSTTVSWIEDLRNFRDALYKNDTARLKTFFKFPVMNEANEIWYLVLTEKELETKKISNGKILPFTEKDFNRYSKKLFPKIFVKALMKLKTDELYKKGATETPGLKDETATSVKLYASFDKKKNVLMLNTSYNTIFKDDNGEIMDGGESNVIYYFKVFKNNHLQFITVRLAG